MPHILNYDGKYVRVEIAEVANPNHPDKALYVGWCSDAFKELKDMPSQALSRFIAGPPLPTYAEALRYACDWIKTSWDAKQADLSAKVGDLVPVIYSVWLFKGDSSLEYEFVEFSDAKAFAKAAEKSLGLSKVGITNNESPQYLTMWQRSK